MNKIIRGKKKCERETRNGKGGLFSWSLRLSDIPAEHKYHSLTVICHFNTDVWSLNSKPLIHIPGHKTQGQFKYGPAGPGMTGYPSLPPSLPLSLSPSLPLSLPSSSCPTLQQSSGAAPSRRKWTHFQRPAPLMALWFLTGQQLEREGGGKQEREKRPFKIIPESNCLLNKNE